MITLVQPGRFNTPAAFDPLAVVAWHSAFWAQDPNWSHPADGAAVSSWLNSGSNGTAATQATSTQQPIYRSSVAALNNKRAVQFDGVNDILDTGVTLAQPYTWVLAGKFFSVVSPAAQTVLGGANARGLWISGGLERVYAGTVGSTTGALATDSTTGHLWIGQFNTSGTDTLTRDGVAGFNAEVGSNTTRVQLSGSDFTTGQPFNGYMGFVGLIGRALTTDEKAALLGWSQSFYGTP